MDTEIIFGFNEPINESPNPAGLTTLASQVAKTITLRSPVNLNKTTLKLLPSTEDMKYVIEFVFDCSTTCCIKIYYNADESNLKSPNAEYKVLQQGLGQIFKLPHEGAVKIDEIREESSIYNVIIVIESTDCTLETEWSIKSQITCCNFTQSDTGLYDLRLMKQKILYQGVHYILHDIFGLDSTTAIAEECVICMSEPKDTVCIPCRHLCVCHQCAQVLKFQSNKCPMCRSSVQSMLKIDITLQGEKAESNDSEESNNEEVVLITNKKKQLEPLVEVGNEVALKLD